MSTEFVLETSEKVLDHLLERRRNNSDLRFWLRQQNRSNRLNQGYWFQGNDTYIFIAFYDRSGGWNMTRSVGFVVVPPESKNSDTFLEIVFKGEEDAKVINFYEKAMERIGGFTKAGDSKHRYHYPSENSVLENLDLFLSEHKPKMDQLLEELDLRETLAITEEKFKKSLERTNSFRSSLQDISVNSFENNNHLNNVSPNNLILYGPPGTGKTYSTKAYAVSLARHGDDLKKDYYLEDENRKECTDVYKDLRSQSKIEFVTFHQSFAYEDFVQGIRPNVNQGEYLHFARQDGVFKTICTNAFFEYYKLYWKEEKEKKRKVFDDLWQAFLSWCVIHADNSTQKNEDLQIKFETKSGKDIDLTFFSYTNPQNFYITPKGGGGSYVITKNKIQELHHMYGSINDIKNVSNDIQKVIGGVNTSAYWAVFNELKKFENRDKSSEEVKEEDLDSMDYRNKWERISNFENLRPFTNEPVPQYVLVIDEINRANISRVLGELITLLEPDKRLGGDEELIVKLPSGEDFAVPPNLHIIGTMNTADKSIAHLDVALRRRFKFVPKYPEHYRASDNEKAEFLRKLNNYIAENYNADLTIGHSYFMDDEESIVDIMENKVMPLLNEYFNQQYDEIKEMLEKCGLEVQKKENGFGMLECTGYKSAGDGEST